MEDKLHKILLVRTDKIGDLVISTAAAECVKKNLPGAFVGFMVRKGHEVFLQGNPFEDEVIPYEKSFFSKLLLIARLRKERFDAAVILHSTRSVNAIMFFAGVPVRVGYRRKAAALLNKSMPYLKKQGLFHEHEYNMKLLELLGMKDRDCAPRLWPSEESRARVEGLFKNYAVTGADKPVLVHPGASCPSKRWPAEKFAGVISLLAQDPALKIAVIASREERAIAGEVIARTQRKDILDFSGQVSLGDLAALAARSALLVSNDSGPVHIAAAVGTPVISIFGRSDPGLSPTRWRP